MQIEFDYINHRGEKEHRAITFQSIEFLMTPGYGYQPGWFVSGTDASRQGARRSFALSRIVFDEESVIGRKAFTLIKAEISK